jgi:hypothetical protein
MSFIEKLKKISTPVKEEKCGTYVSISLKNSKDFQNWFKRQGINYLVQDVHCTIAYSRNYFNHIANPIPITVYPEDIIGFDAFSSNTDSRVLNVLVLKISKRELNDRFDVCQREGATSDFDSYKAHISITYEMLNIDIDKL